jgi:hypothetical protein
MENNPFSQTLAQSQINIIDTLRKQLINTKLQKKQDFDTHYKLLEELYNTIRPDITPTDQENGDQAINLIHQELEANKKGNKQTHFIHLTKLFEQDLNQYIKKKFAF